MRFLFWNVGDRTAENPDLPTLVSRLGATYLPDLIVLFEAGNAWDSKNQDVKNRTRDLGTTLCRDLSSVGKENYGQVDIQIRGGLLLTSLPNRSVKPVPLQSLPPLGGRRGEDRDRRRLDAVHLTGADPEILVFMVHAPSKLHADDLDQQLFFAKLGEVIRQAEKDMSIDHSIIIGDLNADPFEASIAGAPFLHASMSRELGDHADRTVRGKKYGKGFYNPMWSRFGDETDGPAGTYFYNSGQAHQIYWHMFDQVLLRPGLVRPFNRLGPIRIIDEVLAGRSLAQELMKRRKRTELRPDHLPVLFDLDV